MFIQMEEECKHLHFTSLDLRVCQLLKKINFDLTFYQSLSLDYVESFQEN